MIPRSLSMILVVSALALLSSPSRAQAPEDTTYGSARGITVAGVRFNCTEVRMNQDSLSYRSSEELAGGEESAADWTVIPTQSVSYLEVQTGTRALPYALAGAVGGALGAWAGTLSGGKDFYGDPVISSETKTALIVGCGVLGLLVGAISGSKHAVYTTVLDRRASGDEASKVGVRFSPRMDATGHAGVALTLNLNGGR
jgi:hypothetical protein